MLTVKFYLKGGHVIETKGVEELTMQKNSAGNFISYKITWVEGYKPEFFSLVLDDIVAVIADRVQ